jgi:hypothetical protein
MQRRTWSITSRDSSAPPWPTTTDAGGTIRSHLKAASMSPAVTAASTAEGRPSNPVQERSRFKGGVGSEAVELRDELRVA